MLRLFWFLNASTTCFFVFVICWSSSILKKVVIFTKPKKNQKTAMKKTNIKNKKLWMKITLYASKSTAGSVELRQHFFLSLIYKDQIFQHLIFFRSIKCSIIISFYNWFNTEQNFNSWFFEIKRNFRQHLFLSLVCTGQHLIS